MPKGIKMLDLPVRSKNFNIELLEVIFGCCVTNTYDDDTMSPDVGIKSNLIINRNVVLSRPVSFAV